MPESGVCAQQLRSWPARPPPSQGLRGRAVWVGAHLEDVKRDPLTEPKQERPTKTGMIQDMTPR